MRATDRTLSFGAVVVFVAISAHSDVALSSQRNVAYPGTSPRSPAYTPFLGMAIAISQVRGFIVFLLIFLVFWIKLRMEEQWMRSQFGEAYATYARQTAALVPYLL